jgi:hypothetical protein
VVIDSELLLGAVTRLVNEAGMPAHAENVSVELGRIADVGGYVDARIVAEDLEELESLGRLERVCEFDWGGSDATRKTRIAYRTVDAEYTERLDRAVQIPFMHAAKLPFRR